MKIIDILNKIANGEEVKFKTIDEQLEYYCKENDFLRDRNNQEVNWWLDSEWLNKEVEIIEEEKKIEPIEWNIDDDNCQIYYNGAMNYVSRAELELAIKINEIIDYLKSKGE